MRVSTCLVGLSTFVGGTSTFARILSSLHRPQNEVCQVGEPLENLRDIVFEVKRRSKRRSGANVYTLQETNNAMSIGFEVREGSKEVCFYQAINDLKANIDDNGNWKGLVSFFYRARGILEYLPENSRSGETQTLLVLSPPSVVAELAMFSKSARWLQVEVGDPFPEKFSANRRGNIPIPELIITDHNIFESLVAIVDSPYRFAYRFYDQCLITVNWQLDVLEKLVNKLTTLENALKEVPPQMWIGSNIHFIVSSPAPGTATAGAEVKLQDWVSSTLCKKGGCPLNGMSQEKVNQSWISYLQGIGNLRRHAQNTLRSRQFYMDDEAVEISLQLWSHSPFFWTQTLEDEFKFPLIFASEGTGGWKSHAFLNGKAVFSFAGFRLESPEETADRVFAVSLGVHELNSGLPKQVFFKILIGNKGASCRSVLLQTTPPARRTNFYCPLLVKENSFIPK